MKALLGILMILSGIVLGLYVGVYLLFVGGIIQVIESVTPVIIAKGIAFGILKVMFASAVGSLSVLLLAIPGVALIK